MVDHDPGLKQEENYPLLKVDAGGGDSCVGPQAPLTTVSPGWTIASGRKHSWLNRWPELFSACWMTFILLGISLLVFYAIGISVYRHQGLIFVNCNDTRPYSQVFYHQIVSAETYFPFSSYYGYLSNMVTQYPDLRLNWFFLIDDSQQYTFNKLVQTRKTNVFEKNNRRSIQDFRLKYKSVNLTIMLLSKFMATTPMRFNWRTIPVSYLSFYVRTFSVWRNGGIGMDLSIFNARFNSRSEDNRIKAILKQHNDGIQPEIYSNALSTIDSQEETEFFALINQFLNEIRSLLNKTMFFSTTSEKRHNFNEPRKGKREVKDLFRIKSFDENCTAHRHLSNSSNNKGAAASESKLNSSVSHTLRTVGDVLTFSNSSSNNTPSQRDIRNIFPDKMNATSEMKRVTNNSSESPSVMFFYEFSFLSDGMEPVYVLPDFEKNLGGLNTQATLKKNTRENRIAPQLLAIDSEGVFVAASARLHPLLGYLIGNGCHHLHPKFAIQNALSTHCSRYFRNDLYCDNIFLL
ncbi:uncharacterized protein LOC114240704 [Bombyx mandarina]|uniref:Uncharacterized protein LOC114240704 n=1 Tax=Bombyx mandarina TaxID=7092 RepID=A0A6J2JCY0_BOMMA|nr:uncharacterized protein LOC114240704 [Bombyx mandarina]